MKSVDREAHSPKVEDVSHNADAVEDHGRVTMRVAGRPDGVVVLHMAGLLNRPWRKMGHP